MRSLHGITAIFISFVLISLIFPAGADETGYSYDSDVASSYSDWGEQDFGTNSFLSLESLLGDEFISSIIQFLIRLFLSLFSGYVY